MRPPLALCTALRRAGSGSCSVRFWTSGQVRRAASSNVLLHLPQFCAPMACCAQRACRHGARRARGD
eukprot:5092360-Pleurochrysis_carterae.AAC.1